MPAHGASRTGKPGRKREAGSAGFADALLSLVPKGKGSVPGTRNATVVRVPPPAPFESKRAEKDIRRKDEKEIRRKDRIGKAPRESALPPPGTAIAAMSPAARAVSVIAAPETPPKKKPAAVSDGSAVPVIGSPEIPREKKKAAVSDGSAATPDLMTLPIPTQGVAGAIATGHDRAPSPGGIPANPLPARGSTRSRDKSPSSRHGVSAVPRRADVPSGSPAKRLEGDLVDRHIVANHDASPTEKRSSQVPLSPEPEHRVVDGGTEAPKRKNPPMEISRESVAAPGPLPRPEPPGPVRTEMRNAGAIPPDGIVPGAASPRKAASGSTGIPREELPRKNAGPDSAGPEHAAPTGGKRDNGTAIPSPRVATERRPDTPERVDRQPAGSVDPGKGASFPGLLAASSGVEPNMGSAPAPSPSAPAAPMPGAPLPVPLFEQVAMKMTPLSDGAHDVEIRLTPEHLGKLKIELHIDSGRVDASVHADNSEARALLLREEPALREALRNAGVTLSSFNVALSGEPWREGRGGTQPNGDADSAPRRGRKEERVEGVASSQNDEIERDGMNRTEHWIA